MLRDELVEASQILCIAFDDMALYEQLSGLSRGERNHSSENKQALLILYKQYIEFESKLSDIQRDIMERLDLKFLSDPEFWTSVFEADDAPHDHDLYQRVFRIRSAQLTVPMIVALLARNSYEEEAITQSESNKSKISVTIIEEKQKSSPDRLINTIQSINGLYGACATILGKSDNDIYVLNCDSGSDKKFEFVGDLEIIKSVKSIIVSYWDRVVFHREAKLGRRLELISQSLPILDELAELKDKGVIEPEQEGILKRNIINSITAFGESGVTIPEIDLSTEFSPRELMKPEPKLLVSSVSDTDQVSGEDQSIEEASHEDENELKEYIDHAVKRFRDSRGKKDESDSDNKDEEGDV